MAKFRKDYKGVRNLIPTEQVMKGCHPKLIHFLWERKTEKFDDLAELANRYLEAQGKQYVSRKADDAELIDRAGLK